MRGDVPAAASRVEQVRGSAPDQGHLLSRLRRIYVKPSRITFSAAAGTVLAAAVAATALAVGPAASTQPATSGAASRAFAPAANLAGASAPGRGYAASTKRTASGRAQSIARHAARAARPSAAAHPAATSSPAAARPSPVSTPAPPAGTPQQIAQAMLGSYGWSSSQFGCLNLLWTRESGWNPFATNSTSGAYGIPQSLPASKMASAGPDWQTNPATQIRWGLGYIRATYGSPCGAWAHETSYGWY